MVAGAARADGAAMMRPMVRRLLLVGVTAAALTVAGLAIWRTAAPRPETADTIAAQLRCPACQGESVARSSSPVAAATATPTAAAVPPPPAAAGLVPLDLGPAHTRPLEPVRLPAAGSAAAPAGRQRQAGAKKRPVVQRFALNCWAMVINE